MSVKQKILIVEDQFIEANNLQHILQRAGYEICGIARSVSIALKLLESHQPDIVLLDIYLKGEETGIDLAHILKQRGIGFIYLSANSTRPTLDAAKETEPFGFLVKPFREKDVLIMIDIAFYRLQQKNSLSAASISSVKPKETIESGIIGDSENLKTLLEHAELVAPTDTTVLIEGESGTGKEKLADYIHKLSDRANKPLVKVNCAALHATLIESTLFGHEKGAFTGATDRRIGKLELANEGTIFLDEIGEIPFELQAKLLRFLQEKEIERLGGNKIIKLNVRLIAATNRDLDAEVAADRFRLDLYYRLNVFPLKLPPLRERTEDIPQLANHFIELYSKKLGRPPAQVTVAAMEQLTHHTWPGNIRQLQNTIERALLLAKNNTIKSFELESQEKNPPVNTTSQTFEENEREHIIKIVKQCKGKIFGPGGAAEVLGINHSTLNSKMKKLGIEKDKLLF